MKKFVTTTRNYKANEKVERIFILNFLYFLMMKTFQNKCQFCAIFKSNFTAPHFQLVIREWTNLYVIQIFFSLRIFLSFQPTLSAQNFTAFFSAISCRQKLNVKMGWEIELKRCGESFLCHRRRCSISLNNKSWRNCFRHFSKF